MAGVDLEGYGELCEGIRYLTVDALIQLNRTLIQEQTPAEMIGVLKPGELESSQQRPGLQRYYTRNEDMFFLASVLIESLVRNHPFASANKRTAAAAGFVFLLINGYELTAPGHELVELLVGVANNEYSCEDVENWLCHWSRDYDARQLNAPDAWRDMFASAMFAS